MKPKLIYNRFGLDRTFAEIAVTPTGRWRIDTATGELELEVQWTDIVWKKEGLWPFRLGLREHRRPRTIWASEHNLKIYYENTCGGSQ